MLSEQEITQLSDSDLHELIHFTKRHVDFKKHQIDFKHASISRLSPDTLQIHNSFQLDFSAF